MEVRYNYQYEVFEEQFLTGYFLRQGLKLSQYELDKNLAELKGNAARKEFLCDIRKIILEQKELYEALHGKGSYSNVLGVGNTDPLSLVSADMSKLTGYFPPVAEKKAVVNKVDGSLKDVPLTSSRRSFAR